MRIVDLVDQMRETARPGQLSLDEPTRNRLKALTAQLIALDASAITEYNRFMTLRSRELDLSGVRDELRAAYRGKRIVVTGGTGCIGSALIRQLRLCEPAAIYSISRGKRVYQPSDDVVYLTADVSDLDDLLLSIAGARPDVVFHLAAQRSPWLAERAVEETLMTNVIGTRNVLRACRAAKVGRYVHASTGKAMRYHTTDIYAASKKIAEWLVHEYAAEGHLAGAARFTHVVDNGVILEKIQEVIDDPADKVVRIHEPDIQFYVQSAIESAQLLMLAGLNPTAGRLKMVAIRCLGEPVSLLSLACGKLRTDMPAGGYPPIYLSGYDKGYERGNPPGLYDPMTAADFSPLVNAIEAAGACPEAGAPAVDSFHLSLPSGAQRVEAIVDELGHYCAHGDAPAAAEKLAQAGKVLAEVMFDQCPAGLFSRLHRMAQRAGVPLPCQRKAAEERAE